MFKNIPIEVRARGRERGQCGSARRQAGAPRARESSGTRNARDAGA